jgi:hypothetical protein
MSSLVRLVISVTASTLMAASVLSRVKTSVVATVRFSLVSSVTSVTATTSTLASVH